MRLRLTPPTNESGLNIVWGSPPSLQLPPALAFEPMRALLRSQLGLQKEELSGVSLRLDISQASLALFDLRRLTLFLKDEFAIDVVGLMCPPEALARHAERELRLKIHLLMPESPVLPPPRVEPPPPPRLEAPSRPAPPEPEPPRLEPPRLDPPRIEPVRVEAAPLEVKPEIKPELELRIEAKPEVKAEVKPEIQPEIQPEVKAEVKAEIQAEVKPEPKIEVRPEPVRIEPARVEPARVETKIEPKPVPAAAIEEVELGPQGDRVLTIDYTLRSGTLINFAGDIHVFGDVNPGAQIQAGGNIVIFGSLKGQAHAGTRSERAFVMAFDMRPTLLRIGKAQMAGTRNPNQTGRFTPEIAWISNGTIMVDTYKGRLPAKEAL